MTDREKLIEAMVVYLQDRPKVMLEDFADYLISNGVVIREKGEWDDTGRYTFADGKKAVRCPKCGCALKEKEYAENVWNFCPVCGADMR